MHSTRTPNRVTPKFSRRAFHELAGAMNLWLALCRNNGRAASGPGEPVQSYVADGCHVGSFIQARRSRSSLWVPRARI